MGAIQFKEYIRIIRVSYIIEKLLFYIHFCTTGRKKYSGCIGTESRYLRLFFIWYYFSPRQSVDLLEKL